MILIAYRHGLRASEVCDLQWHQVEINSGRLHVRRTKRGTPSVHPVQGDELRALRRLQREQPPGPYVFASERGGLIAPKSFHTLISRLGERESKILAYCGLGGIHDQLRQALDNQDAKAIDALVAKADALEQQLGPEYDKVIEGLELIDLSSAEGQEIAEVFKALQERCE
jgi:integrase